MILSPIESQYCIYFEHVLPTIKYQVETHKTPFHSRNTRGSAFNSNVTKSCFCYNCLLTDPNSLKFSHQYLHMFSKRNETQKQRSRKRMFALVWYCIGSQFLILPRPLHVISLSMFDWKSRLRLINTGITSDNANTTPLKYMQIWYVTCILDDKFPFFQFLILRNLLGWCTIHEKNL